MKGRTGLKGAEDGGESGPPLLGRDRDAVARPHPAGEEIARYAPVTGRAAGSHRVL